MLGTDERKTIAAMKAANDMAAGELRVSQVGEHTDRQSKALAEYSDLVDALRERLGSVLDFKSEGCTEASTPEYPKCPLANTLGDNNGRLEAINYSLSRIIAAIEL